MTTRKVHFDFYADNEAAWCGAVPRNNAPALELSERRKDVDCAKCLKMLEQYDAEVLASTNEMIDAIVIDETPITATEVTDLTDIEFGAYYTPEPAKPEPTQMINNYEYGGPTDLSGPTGNLYRSIADRHGLETYVVENAFNDGILKR